MARLPHPRPQALSWPVARCPPWPAHGRTAGGLASVSGELHLEESFSTACSRLGREETAGSCEATVLRATLLPGQPVGPLHGCARWTVLKLARGPRPIGARVTHSPISEPGSNRYTDSHTQPHTSKPPGRPQRPRVCRRRTRATSAWAEQSAVTGSRALLHPSSLLPPPPSPRALTSSLGRDLAAPSPPAPLTRSGCAER